MARHVVGTLEEMPPGTRHRVEVANRAIAIFNVDGKLFAVKDVCPHQGAPLSAGLVVRGLAAKLPGQYELCEEIHVKCPWHGWEYDLATGKSWYDPDRDRVRAYDVSVEAGTELVNGGRLEGPYVAETFQVSVENDYVVVEV